MFRKNSLRRILYNSFLFDSVVVDICLTDEEIISREESLFSHHLCCLADLFRFDTETERERETENQE